MARRVNPDAAWNERLQRYQKYVKCADGKWRPVYGLSKGECKAKARAREEQEKLSLERVDSPLVWQYLADWFALWSPGKGDRNITSTREAINLHIVPVIGNMQLTDVTEEDLLRVMAPLADKSASLYKKVLSVLKWSFHAAAKNGYIASDPAEDLSTGGKPPKEKIPLTIQQEQTLLSALEGTSIYPFVRLVLGTGLRREEALALQWDSVSLDDDTPYVSVRRALRWKNNQPEISDELKTPAAKRDIPIEPELAEYLKGRKALGGSYVVSGKKAWTETSFKRAWDAIGYRSVRTLQSTDKNGKTKEIHYKLGDKVIKHDFYITIDFSVTPHQLRHTYITKLILAGVNIKVVQYLAGHASVDITLNIYTHLMANRPKDIAPEVIAALKSASTSP